MRKEILEAKDLDIYKRLLNVLGDYCDKFPATSVDRLFDILAEKGKKCLPKDKRALDILQHILLDNESSVPATITKLLNHRFRDLPANLKPIVKNGRRHDIAFWCRDKKVNDQIRSLLNFEDGGSGFWSDVDCKKLALLDTKESNKES